MCQKCESGTICCSDGFKDPPSMNPVFLQVHVKRLVGIYLPSDARLKDDGWLEVSENSDPELLQK